MPGPMSYPAGNRRKYDELNDTVCNKHYTCDMQAFDKHGDEIVHEYITYREWLARRGRLRTGKTV